MPGDVTPEIVIEPYRDGDEHEILRVFNKVFNAGRSLDVWRWEYARNPAGLHCFLALTHPERRVISQFCGVPRRTKVRDKVLCFSEIVDSFTDPDFRQGLKKPGWFAKTCYAFVEHFGRPDREVIMYGLPNPPAFRVGRRLLGYVHLYRVDLLTKAVERGGPPAASALPGGGTASVVTRFSRDVNDLNARLSRHHEVMTIRDHPYLDWRFSDRPDVAYEQVEHRDQNGRLFGLSVLRHRWLDRPVTVACELMVDREHPFGPEVVRDAEARARRAGCEKLQVLFRPESPEWNGLAAMGYEPERSQFRLVARTYDKVGVALDWLKEAWYVTLGDFDVV